MGHNQGSLEIRLQGAHAHEGLVSSLLSSHLHSDDDIAIRRVESTVAEFVKLYSLESGSKPFTNVSAVSSELGWSEITSQTIMDYLDSQGIDARFTRELVEAATRVNYGQVNGPTFAHATGALMSARTPTKFTLSRGCVPWRPPVHLK